MLELLITLPAATYFEATTLTAGILKIHHRLDCGRRNTEELQTASPVHYQTNNRLFKVILLQQDSASKSHLIFPEEEVQYFIFCQSVNHKL